VAEAEARPEAEPDAEIEAGIEAEAETELEPEAEPASEAEAELEAELEPGPPCANGAPSGSERCEGYHRYRCAGGDWVRVAADTVDCSPYRDRRLVVLVDAETHAALLPELRRYADDVQADTGARVQLLPGTWDEQAVVRARLQAEYAAGDLLGALLVGDVAFAYVALPNRVLSDYYYQDLVGGEGDTAREVFSARLLPPVAGAAGQALLRGYLDRNHAFRQGQTVFDDRILFFNPVGIREAGLTEEQYRATFGDLGGYLGLPWETALLYVDSDRFCAEKARLVAAIQQPVRLSILHSHGAPTQQWLYECSLLADEVRAASSGALFVSLQSCSNGRFDAGDYQAAAYLFHGQTLAVEANTDGAMIIGGGAYIDFLRGYQALAAASILGEVYRREPASLLPHLFGDPMLRLYRREAYPALALPDGPVLDFGAVTGPERIVRSLRVRNQGHAALNQRWWRQGCTVGAELAVNCPFNYNTGQGMVPVQVPAGGEALIPRQIYPGMAGFREPVQQAPMAAEVELLTDDPQQPFVTLTLTAVVTAE